MEVNSYRDWSACDRTETGVGNNTNWTDKASRAFTGVPISHLQTVRCANSKRGEELRYTPLSSNTHKLTED